MLNQCKISGFADEINKDFNIQLRVLNEIEQKYIELRGADGINVADMTLAQAEEFQNRMEAADIHVSALGSPIGKIKITDDFAPHFAQFKHIVELSQIFKTPYIRMFSFYIPQGEKPEDYREEVLSRLERFVDYAREKNVILLHENEKGIYGDNAVRCEELMKALYGEHFQCTFDFANFVQCRQDTLEAYRVLAPYIKYIHIKDAKWQDGEVVVAGDGDGHVQEILADLEQNGFQGYLSLEPHLFSFAGFEKLESDARQRKEKDGIAAYKKAYHRLIDLLEK